MRAVRDFCGGVALYWRGFRMWVTDPTLMALGLLPGFITASLLVGGLLAMRWWLEPASTWVADRLTNDGPLHDLVEVAATLGIVGAALLVAIYGFVSITSVVGQPFFEHISHRKTYVPFNTNILNVGMRNVNRWVEVVLLHRY